MNWKSADNLTESRRHNLTATTSPSASISVDFRWNSSLLLSTSPALPPVSAAAADGGPAGTVAMHICTARRHVLYPGHMAGAVVHRLHPDAELPQVEAITKVSVRQAQEALRVIRQRKELEADSITEDTIREAITTNLPDVEGLELLEAGQRRVGQRRQVAHV